ncbi:hypothetical protein M0812_00500 [Anaeramoeba flamelloides]|uniref:HAT C-terminal dimerisation domain-containing protein n=1 Tax=Anaeramoeba flamelloides TaxID=1746091 RepID=A0AAV8A5D1_9EUKA|nr:hypothetical protein M0812_00500 [Anaeramoeba flamelloides]
MKHLISDKHLKSKRRFEKILSEDIPKKLVKVIYQCGINLSEGSKLLENNQFIDIIKSIKHIPSNSTLRRTVHQLLEEEQNRINELLKNSVFSLIIDETTDSNSRSWVGIIISNCEFSLCVDLVHANSCTASNLQKYIIETLLKYNIEFEQIQALITDGAPTCMCLGRNINKLGIKHVVCGAHTLHLISQIIIQNFDKVNILCAKINKFFYSGNQSKRKQRWLQANSRMINKPSLTRWGTWLQTCLDIYNNKVNLIKFLDHEENTKLKEKILLLLDNLEVSEQLKIIKYLGGLLIPLIKLIQNKIITNQLIDSFNNFSNFFFDEKVETQMKIIQTQFNFYSFNTKKKLKEIFNCIKNKYLNRWDIVKEIIKINYWMSPFYLKRNIFDPQIIHTELLNLDILPVEFLFNWKELQKFIFNNNFTIDDNPIKFWTSNKKKFPKISEHILKKLSIKPTSCEVERLFSFLTHIDSPRRNQLNDISLKTEVILKYNQ